MKLFVVIYLLGACLNLALAQPEIETILNPVSIESNEEPSKPSEPQFTNLVKSTMDLLGPIDEMEEVSMSTEVENQ
jgi:hypothetical protein